MIVARRRDQGGQVVAARDAVAGVPMRSVVLPLVEGVQGRDPRLDEQALEDLVRRQAGEEEVPAWAQRAAVGDRPLTYRVRSGDSLGLIAARTMGSANRWRRLYEHNRDVIGPNPERLTEGMELRIPSD